MKKNKVSIILNILIVVLVILGSLFMFLGIKFMPSQNLLVSTKIGMFKYYTVDSNILIGLISLILVIYEIKYKNKKIPNYVYILKLIGTCAITLTFATTLLFLAPQYGFYAMYNNSNLFFHLLVPLLAIISYIFFEHHNPKYRYAFLGIIPMIIYSIYYSINVITHLDDGGLTYKYDFYGFLQGNINNLFIVIPIIYLVTYLMSVIIIYLNNKISKRN